MFSKKLVSFGVASQPKRHLLTRAHSGSKMIYDVLVLGSGSVGSATGYYASKLGLKVLMIDGGTPPHNLGTHHGASRLIRCAYGEGPKYVPMVLRARDLWKELNAETKTKIYEDCGILNVGPEGAVFIENAKKSAELFKINVENLNVDEIKKRWSAINVPDGYVGLFEQDAGFVRSEKAVEAYVRLSKEAGAEQAFNCDIKSLKHSDGLVEVETSQGTFKGAKAVLSLGTWVKKFYPDLPFNAVRKVFMWYKADPIYEKLPGFICLFKDHNFYGFPADRNGLKVGKHNEGQIIKTQEELKPFGAHPEDFTEQVEFLKNFFPNIGEMLEGKSCTYDVTPDEHFIIDKLPGSDNVLLITGLSGHGFKFASVLGEMSAQFASGQQIGYDIGPFSLDRFK